MMMMNKRKAMTTPTVPAKRARQVILGSLADGQRIQQYGVAKVEDERHCDPAHFVN